MDLKQEISEDGQDGEDDDDEDDELSSVESGPMHYVFSPEDMVYDEEEFFNHPDTSAVKLRKAKSLDCLDDDSKDNDDFYCCKSKSLDHLDSICMRNEIDQLHGELDSFQKVLDSKDNIISQLQEKNDTTDLLQTISDLKIECRKKDEEIKRLGAVEKSFKQTKQVLKDTTWTLKVKEEELNSIKADMRRNYEKRLNEILSQLNEKEIAIADFHSENQSLQESEKNNILRIEELSQQVKLLLAKQPSSPSRKFSEPFYADATSTPIQMKKRSQTWSNDLSFDAVPEEEEAAAENKNDIDNNLQKQNIEDYEQKIQMLENELTKSRQHVNELYQMMEGVSTNSDMLPTTQVAHAVDTPVDSYLLHPNVARDNDSIDGLDELNSLRDDVLSVASEGDISERGINLKKQMDHTIKHYEEQINDLQKQYDQDVLTLEQDKKELESELEVAKKSLVNLNSSALDNEELQEQFETKMSYLKKYYDEQQEKHLQVAKDEIKTLCMENEELKNTLATFDEQHKEDIKKLQDQIEESYKQHFQNNLEQALEQQQESLSSVQQGLQEELSQIQTNHDEMYNDINQKFSSQRRLSAIENSYSNELVLLHEDKVYLEHKVQTLQDELQTVQTEYDQLKIAFQGIKSDKADEENTVKIQAQDMEELQVCVQDMNQSVLDIQTDLGTTVNNESNMFEKSVDIGYNFHEDIKLLRANLNDAKSDVQNLVAERDEFSQLSSTLSDQLTHLKSEIEKDEKKRALELIEKEKNLEKNRKEKELLSETLGSILSDLNTEVKKKLIPSTKVTSDSVSSLDDDSIKIMVNNITEEVCALKLHQPTDLSHIFMNQCKYLVERIEQQHENNLKHDLDLLSEEYNKNISVLNTEHENEVLLLQENKNKEMSALEEQLLDKQQQAVLQKESNIQEYFNELLKNKEIEFNNELNKIVEEIPLKVEKAVSLKEAEMLEKLHQSVVEKEKEMQEKLEKLNEEQAMEMQQELEKLNDKQAVEMQEKLKQLNEEKEKEMQRKDEEYKQQLEEALHSKVIENEENLSTILADRENDFQLALNEKEEEFREMLQEEVEKVMLEKDAELMRKDKDLEKYVQDIIQEKDQEIEEKLRQVVSDIEIEMAEQLQHAINNTEAEMQQKLDESLQNKENELLQEHQTQLKDKDMEMEHKIKNAVDNKEAELLDRLRTVESDVTEKMREEKANELEALVTAHEEELSEVGVSYQQMLNDSKEIDDIEISNLKKLWKEKSILLTGEIQQLKSRYLQEKEDSKKEYQDFLEALKTSRISIINNINSAFESHRNDVINTLSNLLLDHVMNSSVESFQKEEMVEKLRDVFKRAVQMQQEHLEFFYQQFHQRIDDIFSRIQTLESQSSYLRTVNEFEDSIEKVADEYVVLALNTSMQDVISDASFATPSKKRREKRRKSSSEQVYNISVQSETFIEEEKVVDVSDSGIQTETKMVDTATETIPEVVVSHFAEDEISTLTDDLSCDIYTQTDVDLPTLVKLEKDLVKSKNDINDLSSENYILRQSMSDYELTGREQMRVDLMKQHESLMDEFIKEQEKEMQALQKDYQSHLDDFNVDVFNAVNDLKKEIQSQLQQEDEEFLLATDISLANVTESSQLNQDWSAELSELKELLNIVKLKHLEDLSKLQSIKERVMDELSNKLAQQNQKLILLEEQQAIDLAKCEEETRLAMEEEHLENLAELEKSLEEKHVEQLQKLQEFQQMHLKEVARIQEEHDSHLQAVKDSFEERFNTVKAEKDMLTSQSREDKETLTDEFDFIQDREDSTSSNEKLLFSCLMTTLNSLQQSEKTVHNNLQKYIQEHENSNIDVNAVLMEDSILDTTSMEDVHSIQSKAIELSSRMTDVISYLLTILEETTQELNDNVSSYTALSNQYNECTQQLETKQKDCEVLNNEVETVKQQCQQLEDECKSVIDTISKMQEESTALYLEKEQLFVELKEKNETLENVNEKKRELDEQLSILSKEQEVLQGEMNEVEGEYGNLKEDHAEIQLEKDKLFEEKERLGDELAKMTNLYEEAEQYNSILAKEIENIKQSLEAEDNELKTRCVGLEEELGQLQQSLKVETGKNKQLFESLDLQNIQFEENKRLYSQSVEQCKILTEECEKLRKALDVELEKNSEMYPIFTKQSEEITKLRHDNTELKQREGTLMAENIKYEEMLANKNDEVYGKLLVLTKEYNDLKDKLKDAEDKHTEMFQVCDEQTQEIDELKCLCNANEEKCNTAKQNLESTETRCKELEKLIDDKDHGNEELLKILKDQENELSQVKSHHDESNERCLSLEHEFEELNRILETNEQKNADLNELLSSKNEELAALNILNEELHHRCEQLENDNEQLKDNARVQYDELEEKFKKLTASFNQQNEQNKELYKTLDSQAAELASSKVQHNTEHVELKKECEELTDRITKMTADFEDYELVKQQCEVFKSSLESYTEMHEADQELIAEQEILHEKMTSQLQRELNDEKEVSNLLQKQLESERTTSEVYRKETEGERSHRKRNELKIAELENDVVNERSEKKCSELKVSELEKEIVAERTERKCSELKVDELQNELEKLRNEVASLNDLIENMNDQVNSARGRSEKLAAEDGNSTMKLLIADIQQEADDVLDLVLNSPDFNMEGDGDHWNTEKQALLENIKALKNFANKNKESIQKSAEAKLCRELSEAEEENRNLRTALDDLRMKLKDLQKNMDNERIENELQSKETNALSDLVAQLTSSLNAEKSARHKEQQQLNQEVMKNQSLTEALQKNNTQLRILREKHLDEKPGPQTVDYEALLKNECIKQDSLKKKLKDEISQSKELRDLIKSQQEELDRATTLLTDRVDPEKYEKLKAAYLDEKHKNSRLHKAMRRSEDEMQSKINNLQNINTSLQNDVEDLLCFNASNNDEFEQQVIIPKQQDVVVVEDEEKQPQLSEAQKKLLTAGWTLAKVQRLYLKYFRAESFRRALSYQKKYLQILLKRYEAKHNVIPPNNNNNTKTSKFKAVVIMIVAINRMKYFVRKYQRNLHKSSAKYHFKDSRPNHKHKTRVPSIIKDGSDTVTLNGFTNDLSSARPVPLKMTNQEQYETPSVRTTPSTLMNDFKHREPRRKHSSTLLPGGERMMSPKFENGRDSTLFQPILNDPVGPAGSLRFDPTVVETRHNFIRLNSTSDESVDLVVERKIPKPSSLHHTSYNPSDDVIAKANSILGNTPSISVNFDRQHSPVSTTDSMDSRPVYKHRSLSPTSRITGDETFATLKERNSTHSDAPCSYPRPSNTSPSTLPPSRNAIDITGVDRTLTSTFGSGSRLEDSRLPNHRSYESNKENVMLNDYIRKLESLQHRLMKK